MTIKARLQHFRDEEISKPFQSHPVAQSIFSFIQIATLSLAVWWYVKLPLHLPVPGVAVAWIAVVAAVMSVQPDMRNWQKAAWILIIGILLNVETHAIAKDRSDNDQTVAADRKQQDDNFNGIRTQQESEFRGTVGKLQESVQQSEEQFEKTMSASQRIAEKASAIAELSKENIAAATGGDSFAIVMFTEIIGNEANMLIFSKGKYALRDVQISIVDVEAHRIMIHRTPLPPLSDILALRRTENAGNLLKSGHPLQTKIPIAGLDHIDLVLTFSSLNPLWSEDLKLRKVDGHWRQAYRVQRADPRTNKQMTLESYADPEYPKVAGSVDWGDPHPQPR